MIERNFFVLKSTILAYMPKIEADYDLDKSDINDLGDLAEALIAYDECGSYANQAAVDGCLLSLVEVDDRDPILC